MSNGFLKQIINRLYSRFYQFGFIYYDLLLKYYAIIVTWVSCSRKYKARIHPTHLIYINPNNIDRKMVKRHDVFDHSDYICEVKQNHWEDSTELIDEYDMYQAFIDRFENQIQWEETSFFERVVDIIKSGREKWGCSSEEKFLQRCHELDALYEDMKENGYKTQRELLKTDVDTPLENTRKNKYAPELHEVVVNIGSDGELYLHDGRNRFLVARILGIESIPVRVKARHEEWQKIRDSIVEQDAAYPEDIDIDHPDLRELRFR